MRNENKKPKAFKEMSRNEKKMLLMSSYFFIMSTSTVVGYVIWLFC